MQNIAIIIVNWNKRQALADLLRSLEIHAYRNYPIYVVDNASTDDSAAFLKKHYPDITLLQNTENSGGSGGFNTGLRAILENNYDFVWLLDNDAKVRKGALEALVQGMAQDDKIAIVGSKILHADAPEIVSEIGARLHPLTLFTLPQYHNVFDNSVPPEQFIEVDYVAACSLLARVAAVRKVGLWEEYFFLLWDDMEWCMRFKRYGYRVIASTASAVIHRGFSERELTPDFIYYAVRNHLYFARKSYFGWRRIYYLAWLFGVFHYLKSMYSQSAYHLAYQKSVEYALDDFIHNIQGKNQHPLSMSRPTAIGSLYDYTRHKTLVLSTACPAVLLKKIVSSLEQQDAVVYLSVSVRRIHLFSWHPPERILPLGKPLRHHPNTLFIKFLSEKSTTRHDSMAETVLTIDNDGTLIEILDKPFLRRNLNKIKLRFSQILAFSAGVLHALALGISIVGNG